MTERLGENVDRVDEPMEISLDSPAVWLPAGLALGGSLLSASSGAPDGAYDYRDGEGAKSQV